MIVIVALVVGGAGAMPSKSNDKPPKVTLTDSDRREYGNINDETILKVKQCEDNIERMELCMRCAKESKSQIVYPLCCANEDKVGDWCHDYIYYGQ